MLKLNGYQRGLGWTKDLGVRNLKPYYSTQKGVAFHQDSLDVLARIPSNSIDLVVTSPPFALLRKKEYGNEPADRYLDWFWPFCEHIHRVLKPTGSFVLDIGGSWVRGAPVRSLYHFEVAIRIAKLFYLAQEFYWYNPAKLPTPAEWVTIRRIRVKDAVNMVWWFSKEEYPKANNRNVLQPYSKSMQNLIKNGYTAKMRPSGHDISDAFQKDNGGAIPPNLLEFANTESNSRYLRSCKARGIKPHPARYPDSLVEFFVNFLTDPDDLVFDPFGGSNVTGSVCERLERNWIVSELDERYLDGSKGRFADDGLFSDIAAKPIRRKKSASV